MPTHRHHTLKLVPHCSALLTAVCMLTTKVVGSEPVVIRPASSAKPITLTISPSNSWRKSSKAKFHARGESTPPCGVPRVPRCSSIIITLVCEVFRGTIVTLTSITSDSYLSILPCHGGGGADRHLDATSSIPRQYWSGFRSSSTDYR